MEYDALLKPAEIDAIKNLDLSNLPNLTITKAYLLGDLTSMVGFNWADGHQVKEKIFEEIMEVDEAAVGGDLRAVEGEVGDVLFAVCQWARHLGVSPERGLITANLKFKARFEVLQSLVKPGYTRGDFLLLWSKAKIILEEAEAQTVKQLTEIEKGK